MTNRVAVVDSYMSKFGRYPYKTIEDLIVEMSTCLIYPFRSNIDRLYVGNFGSGYFTGQIHLAPIVARAMGLHPIPSATIEGACASGSLALLQGIMAIMSGLSEMVLVVGVEKMTGMSREETTKGITMSAYPEEIEAGLNYPKIFARIANNYFAKYGATKEYLDQLIVLNHKYASNNPKAHTQVTIEELAIKAGVSMEEFLKSEELNPTIEDPLRRYDCCPVSDGAAFVVLASEDMTRDLNLDPIWIKGFGHGSDWSHVNGAIHFNSTKRAAREAFDMALLDPSEIDIAEIHDGFTIAEIIHIEDLGLMDEGKAYKQLTNGNSIPVNVTGGLNCKGHPIGATGIAQVHDIYNFMIRHNHEFGLCNGFGGTGGTSVVTIFERR